MACVKRGATGGVTDGIMRGVTDSVTDSHRQMIFSTPPCDEPVGRKDKVSVVRPWKDHVIRVQGVRRARPGVR